MDSLVLWGGDAPAVDRCAGVLCAGLLSLGYGWAMSRQNVRWMVGALCPFFIIQEALLVAPIYSAKMKGRILTHREYSKPLVNLANNSMNTSMNTSIAPRGHLRLLCLLGLLSLTAAVQLECGEGQYLQQTR